MNTYEAIHAYVIQLPVISDWPELRQIWIKANQSEPYMWELPIIGCEAAGGSKDQAIPIAAAVAALHTSIILIDDMLDEDPRGEHQIWGKSQIANFAAAFQAVGLEAIVRSQASEGVKLAAFDSLNYMLCETTLGQYWDTQTVPNEAAYWQVVQTKSAPFFRESLYVGAVLGGASKYEAMQVRKIGHLYGELIQINDDVSDVLSVPASPDWATGRNPLPILYAQTVDHPDRHRFQDLRQEIADPQALAEAHSILIRCGAISYAIAHLLDRHQQTEQILQATNLPRRNNLEALLDRIIQPVNELFDLAS